MSRPHRDLLDRLADKFTVGDGCWEWTASKTPAGYGQLRDSYAPYKALVAHRVVYELLKGPIPEGLELDHLCHNPGCVRPDHLDPVTHQVNNQRGWRSLAEFCANGHRWSDNNEWRDANGWRQCRACNRESARKRYGSSG